MHPPRQLVAFVAATFIPPLATLLVIKPENITDPTYWLGTLTVTVGSFAAASIFTLTQLNGDAGNPPVVVPPAPTTPEISSGTAVNRI